MDITHRPIFYLRHVMGTGFRLRFQEGIYSIGHNTYSTETETGSIYYFPYIVIQTRDTTLWSSILQTLDTTEDLLGRNSSGSGLENREYGSEDPLRWPHYTLYSQKLALASPTSGGRSVDIVRPRIKATKLLFILLLVVWYLRIIRP
jgi:hypothetical protein